MKHRISLLYFAFLGALSAQDLAPDRVANMIYEKTSSSFGVTVSVLLSNTGIAYTISAIEVGRPLLALSRYTWRRTSANSGTLGLGNGPDQAETFVTFATTRSGTYRDNLGAGSITFTAFPLSSDAPLRNVSTRATLTPGQPAIVGFVVAGSVPRRVLVRAIGPSLMLFGVTNGVANPVLTVLKGNTPVGVNSGWGGAPNLAATFSSVGAFALPATSRDAAILLTLDSGNYTAQVRADGGGEALMEVYFVD